MASVAQDQNRPSILLTLLGFLVLIVVGFIAFQWVTGIILFIIRLIMILAAFYVMFRIAMYLLRKGR